jgi:hypothetical protein
MVKHLPLKLTRPPYKEFTLSIPSISREKIKIKSWIPASAGMTEFTDCGK